MKRESAVLKVFALRFERLYDVVTFFEGDEHELIFENLSLSAKGYHNVQTTW